MPAATPDIHAIFNEALARQSDEDRLRYLDEVCREAPDVRRRVEALLRAHSDAGGFFGGQATVPPPTEVRPGPAQPGDTIGPYKLLQQIGEGGMGVVYMAEQTEPVERRVALKIIKPGMDTRQVIARFEAERQALAMMDHPNIARVLDAGTTGEGHEPRVKGQETLDPHPLTLGPCTGRPYFVMELVKGVPITRYCDEHQLTPRERLELFLPVCQAVQHAHQKGIIHRDLKPSNILVSEYDDRPVPKVIDFGVAKAVSQRLTERTMFTQYGQIVGTLEYMSPEQAKLNELDVDTRSDVYSLGVLLYELLTGATPLDKQRLKTAAFDEVLRMIREEEPQKPSTRLSTAETLPSIAANRRTEPRRLSGLLRGDLDWIVMKALEKDRTRRYETANGFAADVMRYLADEPVTACPPSAAYRARKFARRNKAALGVVSLVLFLLVLLGSGAGWAVRDRAAREQEIVRERTARQENLEREVVAALTEVEDWHQRENWPEARAAVKRAAGLVATGDAPTELCAHVEQWQADLETVARFERIGSGQGDQYERSVVKHAEFEQEFRALGIDIDALSIEQAAERVRSRAIRPQLIAALESWTNTRRNLAKEPSDRRWDRPPDWWKLPLRVARAADTDEFCNRVRLCVEDNDTDTLVELAQSPQALRLPAMTLSLMARDLHWQAGYRHRDLGLEVLTRAQAARPDEAMANSNLALFLFQAHPEQPERAIRYAMATVALYPENAPARGLLASLLTAAGDHDEAIEHYRKAVEFDPTSAWRWHELGKALAHESHLDQAIAACRESIRLNPADALAHHNLGETLRRMGRLEEAVAVFREVVRRTPDSAIVHAGLGTGLLEQGHTDEAIVCFREAIRLDPEYAQAWSHLGESLLRMDRLEESVGACREAIRISPQDADVHIRLGVALRKQGHVEAATAAYNEAIRLNPDCVEGHTNLGGALFVLGRLDDAVAACREAIRLKPDCAEAHCNLGAALCEKGRLDEASAALREATRLKPDYAAAHYNLGNLLGIQQQIEEAIASYRRAIQLNPDYAEAHNNLRAALQFAGRLDEALVVWNDALRLDPSNSLLHNDLAWLLATCPDPQLRDAPRAVKLAQRAVELAPDQWAFWNTLGVARYRAGEWTAAIEALQKSSDLSQGGNPFDWLFLAMVHWRLDQQDEAREWYAKAVKWIEANATDNEELLRFHTEAAELLGIPDSPAQEVPGSEDQMTECDSRTDRLDRSSSSRG